MKVIIITGWSQSGKDTCADILVEKYGYKKYAVAGPLKDVSAELFGFPRELADTQEGKKAVIQVGNKMKTIREILIHVARIEREKFGKNIYINVLFDTIRKDNPKSLVISDVRYFNEINAFTSSFAEIEIWKIEREGQTCSPVNDPSEYALEGLKPTFTIKNGGTSITDLEKKISDVMNREQLRKNELPTS